MLLGLLPLFKLTAGIVGLAALAGFLVERAIGRRWKALPEAALAALVPVAVAIAIVCPIMPSAIVDLALLRGGGADLSSAYSAAMSYGAQHGSKFFRRWRQLPCWSFYGAFTRPHPIAWQVSTLCCSPFPCSSASSTVSFARSDRIVNFFCFVAMALALASLTISLHGTTLRRVGFLMILFLMIWQDNVGRRLGNVRRH